MRPQQPANARDRSKAIVDLVVFIAVIGALLLSGPALNAFLRGGHGVGVFFASLAYQFAADGAAPAVTGNAWGGALVQTLTDAIGGLR